MKFSILIAHYNNWNYFQECYQSIINQTYQNFEIVIVDDCSTDDSFFQLQRLAQNDSRIKLFKNNENKKVGFTKRRCIEEATGEICGFLDPDDLLEPNALELSIKSYSLPNVVATYSRIKLIDENSKEIGVFKHSRKIKNNKKIFFNINFEVAHFFTFRKAVYDKTEGIRADLIIAEDQDLYLKLYEYGEFCFINEYLYKYRIHELGISQNKIKSKNQKRDCHNVIYDACVRRGVKTLYGKDISSIENLPKFLFEKENTFLKKLMRKLL